MKKILNSLILILLLILFLPQVKADEFFDIKSFHAGIQISENSSFTVEETIDVYFYEDRHGIFRDLDTQDINVRVKDVRNQNDEPWNYTLEDFDLGTRIKIGDADKYISRDQTYKITYDVSRGIRFFDTHDELYWNVTGNYWPASIGKASATVYLPLGISPDQITATCYTGFHGSAEQDCMGKIYENKVEFTSNRALNAYEGMTIVVGIPKNILTESASLKVMANADGSSVFLDGSENAVCETDCTIYLSAGTHQIQISKWGYGSSEVIDVKLNSGKSKEILINLKQQWWRPMLMTLILIILILIALEPIITFWRKGRDPEGRGTIIPEYEPPDKLIPVLMGSLVDERAHMRDITSTIIDLAVRGFLKIKKIPTKKWWIFTSKSEDYELIRQPVRENRLKRLSEFENELLKDIFGTKNSKKLSSLKNKFYKKLPDLKETIYKNLVDKEYFPGSPQKTRTKYLVKGIIIISIALMLLSIEISIARSGFSSLLIINGILTLILANFMPQKTDNGMRAYEHILGFKLYLKTAEKDRIHFQEKEHLFYKFLPYAMTLGIAKKWSRAFGDIFKKPPNWYEGDEGDFHLPVFVGSLNSVSSQIKSTFASRPSSSGGGSGFSGGFSGGGFGGGGGGSW